MIRRYTGVYPVVPTTFTESGALDLESQKRAVDFLIDAHSDGLCILANYSEQFALADTERETLTRSILEHVAGRVPVIVTTTHFSTDVCAERSRFAQEAGAAMVMIMPPYHGASIRASQEGVRQFFQRVSDAISIPIMIQDAPMSGTVLPAPVLAAMAKEIEQVSYFKIEVASAADKLREMIGLGGDAIEGPWDGEESITLLADLDAGATGTMPSAGYPDLLRPIMTAYESGNRDEATRLYDRVLPLINWENKQVGLQGCKSLMMEGGIIKSDAVRHPVSTVSAEARAGFVEIARRLDAMILRWGK
jgi:2-keto-3-deoxy-L-arabinonate dehydratase